MPYRHLYYKFSHRSDICFFVYYLRSRLYRNRNQSRYSYHSWLFQFKQLVRCREVLRLSFSHMQVLSCWNLRINNYTGYFILYWSCNCAMPYRLVCKAWCHC